MTWGPQDNPTLNQHFLESSILRGDVFVNLFLGTSPILESDVLIFVSLFRWYEYM